MADMPLPDVGIIGGNELARRPVDRYSLHGSAMRRAWKSSDASRLTGPFFETERPRGTLRP